MAQSVIATRTKLAPHEVSTTLQVQDKFFRIVAGEVGRTVSVLSRRIAADPDASPMIRQTFGFMANATGQWAALMNFAVYGSGLSQGIGGLLANELAPVVQKAFMLDPNAVHLPATLAALVARGYIPQHEGQASAKRSALSEGKFNQLIDLSFQTLGPPEAMELWRRGRIDSDRFRNLLRRAGYDVETIGDISHLKTSLIEVASLAEMVDRGELSFDAAAGRAAHWGFVREDFQRLVNIVGVPPATEDLLAGFRRGIISKERLARGIRQSPLRSEWIDFIEKLQFAPMTYPEAVDAASQNYLTKAQAKHICELNGLRGEDFEVLFNTAGRPPGIEEMLELWNRGEVTEAQVTQAMLESPLKNKWVEVIKRTRRKIIPQEQVRMLVKQGVITPRQGIERLMDNGYSRADAEAFVRLAQADKTETDKDLTKAEILSLYEFRALSRAKTSELLQKLGYDAGEANFLLEIGELRRQKRETDAATSVIRSKYVAHKISAGEASGQLDQLRIPADMRDHVLDIWTLEREANVVTLTTAQIVRAWKKGAIDEANAMQRLIQHGLQADDAKLLLDTS